MLELHIQSYNKKLLENVQNMQYFDFNLHFHIKDEDISKFSDENSEYYKNFGKTIKTLSSNRGNYWYDYPTNIATVHCQRNRHLVLENLQFL